MEAETRAEATVVRHLVGEVAAIKAAGAAESTTDRTKADKTAVARADMETAMGTTATTTASTRARRRAGHLPLRQATLGTTRACLPRPRQVMCPAEAPTGMRPRRPRDTEATKVAAAATKVAVAATKAVVATRVDRVGIKEDIKVGIRPAPLPLRAMVRARAVADTTATTTADRLMETIEVVATTGEGTTTGTTAAADTSLCTNKGGMGRRQRL